MAQTVSTPHPRRTDRLPPWLRALLVAITLVGTALIVSTVVGIALVLPLVLSGWEPVSELVLVVSLVGTQLSFVAVAFLYLRRCDWSVSFAVPSNRDLRWVVGVAAATVVAAIGLFTLSDALGIEPVESVIEEAVVTNPTLLLVLAALSLVLVGPAEEFLFRGVVQGRLRRTFGAPVAIAVASLLFSLVHLLNLVTIGIGAVVMVAVIFVVAAVLGTAYERTDNLVVPVLIHGAYNTMLFVTAYLSLRGS